MQSLATGNGQTTARQVATLITKKEISLSVFDEGSAFEIQT